MKSSQKEPGMVCGWMLLIAALGRQKQTGSHPRENPCACLWLPGLPLSQPLTATIQSCASVDRSFKTASMHETMQYMLICDCLHLAYFKFSVYYCRCAYRHVGGSG